MRITLRENHAGTFLLVAEDGRDILIQGDWDFPGAASTFGWTPCRCGATDGTVDCEHRARSEMMADAWKSTPGTVHVQRRTERHSTPVNNTIPSF